MGGDRVCVGGGASRVVGAVVVVAVAEVGAVVEVGDRALAAAATAAAAAGLVAMAARSSGESVGGLVVVESGVLGAGFAGMPEWSMPSSGMGEMGRMPEIVGWEAAAGLLAIAIN